MPNTHQYINYFKKPEKVDDKNCNNVIKNFESFNTFYKANIPTNKMGYIAWKYPDAGSYDIIYNNIIKSLALYLGVKVMYRDQLDDQGKPTYGFWFIGDEVRISIMYHIWDYMYYIFINYYNHLYYHKVVSDIAFKRVKKTNAARVIFQKYLDNIHTTIDNLLDVDINYIVYTERHILFSYKLEFKKYATANHLYDHAITVKYKHKMMLL